MSGVSVSWLVNVMLCENKVLFWTQVSLFHNSVIQSSEESWALQESWVYGLDYNESHCDHSQEISETLQNNAQTGIHKDEIMLIKKAV